MAALISVMLRCLVSRHRRFVDSSRAKESLIGTIETVNTTGALTLALMACVEATFAAVTMWNQAYSHGKLSQWHGRLHELLALHFKLFSMKTGSLPVLNPLLNICSSFIPPKRERKSRNNLCCLGIDAVRVGEACSCRCRSLLRLSRHVGRCRRSSLGNEAVNALDHCAVTLHVVADVVVIADVTEDDL